MDFSAWSPSHTLILTVTLLAFFGQLIAILTYLKVTATRHSQEIKQLAEQIQRQEDRMDKRFIEINQRISEVRSELKTDMLEIRSELKTDMLEMRSELKTDMSEMRSELKTEMSEIRSELSKMNQNHIDHLSHHES